MDGNFYTETYTYREGRILLYKRPNSKNFQCRLRVEGIKGYIIKSCDTPNQGKALKFAEDLYDNLRFKKLNNLPLKTKTFRQILQIGSNEPTNQNIVRIFIKDEQNYTCFLILVIIKLRKLQNPS